MGLTLRVAGQNDADAVWRGVCGLAEYERLPVRTTKPVLAAALFGDAPAATALLAYWGDELAGYALYYPTFSSFSGLRGLYLEDLFVWPEWRNRGIGRSLLAHIAQIAVAAGYGRVEWAALDWTEAAVRFYVGLGAEKLEEWTTFRLSGSALSAVADARLR